jgi:hypothetical protein
MEAQKTSILEVAAQGGHTEIVALLWLHCNAEREHLSQGSSISLGFHGIAIFSIETGEFKNSTLKPVALKCSWNIDFSSVNLQLSSNGRDFSSFDEFLVGVQQGPPPKYGPTWDSDHKDYDVAANFDN